MLEKAKKGKLKFCTSWDDGSKLDIRLAKLLKKYNVPATFYIPSNCELSVEEIKYLDKEGFEIGGHTENHPPDLKLLSEAEQEKEILDNKIFLEKLLNKKVDKFCYPKGRYSDVTIGTLIKLGFKEARTTVMWCIDFPTDMYRVKTSMHVYPETPKFNKPDWFKEGCRLYEEAKLNKGYFHLWGHSWEIEKFGLWEELEEFLKFINIDHNL